MNERIKHLLAQAHIEAENIKDTNWIANRFAELLLQDCMSICEEMGDKGMDGHYCVDKIRREFGV